MTERIYNFSAGPAVLPVPVLEEAQRDMLALPGVGMSVMEISHRSKTFDEIIGGAEQGLRELMGIPQNYKVLFLQGGASLQFSMIPMNLLPEGGTADYIITGSWGKKALKEAKRAGTINVASTAAFQPVPYMATYAASKAFVLSFTEALWDENRAYKIRVMALCPGATETNFFNAAGVRKPPFRHVETPEAVVETALRGLDRGKGHIISGWINYVQTQAERLVPRSLVTRIAGKGMRSGLNIKTD
ncbi:MAG TPA: SDR family NAD(P)-dependent oxidoreductase [Pyrinomonadaceae bacterium]